MLLSEGKITEIYCLADDFCKFYGETVKNNALEEPDGKRHRNKPNRLSDAEVITILVAFHMGGHRCLKHFYLEFVCRHWTHLFPKTVSSRRFTGSWSETRATYQKSCFRNCSSTGSS